MIRTVLGHPLGIEYKKFLRGGQTKMGQLQVRWVSPGTPENSVRVG